MNRDWNFRVRLGLRSTRRSFASAAFILALGALVSGCTKEQAAPPARPPTPVTVGVVAVKTIPVEVTAVGNVEAISTISVKAQVPGAIQEVRFKEGDFVRNGQVLFTIDPRPYQIALDQSQAALARDKATAAYNRAQAERYKKLLEEGVVPASQVDSFVSAADASDAVVNADSAAIASAKLNLEYCTISSPIDGRTGSVMLKQGNLVKVADVPIVVINQVNPIYVNFTVPQQYWSDVKKYMAQSTLNVMATVPRDSGPPVQGTLAFVDNSVDSTTGTIHLRATFPNPENRLWPGLYVNVLLTLSEQSGTTVVPAQAVVAGTQGSTIMYVLKPNNTVEQRVVTAGRTVNGETVIEKGVQAGETIVLDGQVQLVPGAKVEIKNSGAVSSDPSRGARNQSAAPPDPPTDGRGSRAQ
jgi:membrane fusion protein, multidrug efflux system